jgi:hypothetical protein
MVGPFSEQGCRIGLAFVFPRIRVRSPAVHLDTYPPTSRRPPRTGFRDWPNSIVRLVSARAVPPSQRELPSRIPTTANLFGTSTARQRVPPIPAVNLLREQIRTRVFRVEAKMPAQFFGKELAEFGR